MTRFLAIVGFLAAAAFGSMFWMPSLGADDGAVRNSAISITDGDTFRIGDERIRISNIDTPEMENGAECAWERNKAQEAKDRLAELLAAGTIRVERSAIDRFGRTLATVTVDGQDVGQRLISEGLAVRWAGQQHEWC